MKDNLKIPYGVSDFKRVISKGCRADKSIPSLARGAMLHQIVFLFKGMELERCEHVAEETLP